MNRTRNVVYLPPESPAIRAAALLAEAKAAADAHIEDGVTMMGDLARLADQIAAGGETYPPGVRDQMRRLADHVEAVANSVSVLMERARR